MNLVRPQAPPRADFLAILSDPDLLQLLLVACPDALIVTTPAHTVALYTGAAEELFGFPPVDVLGRSLARLFPDRRARARLRRQLDAAGRVAGFELPAARHNGTTFPASVSAARVNGRYGETLGTVYYIRDHSSIRAIEETLRRNNEDLSSMVSRLDHLARHDPLTGLLNRAAAFDAAERFLLSAADARPSLGVAVFDLDRFKAVNDTYGHLAGDRVLADFAAALRSHARATDILGRFGGEEFIAFLPSAGLHDTRTFAERIRSAFAAVPLRVAEELAITCTASAGVASIPSCAETIDEAIRIADERLYIAKRTGRNRVVDHDSPTEHAA